MSDRWFELDAGSYLPLPFFPWPERPARLPLDVEEAATSLFLAHGDLNRRRRAIESPGRQTQQMYPQVSKIAETPSAAQRVSPSASRAAASRSPRHTSWQAR